jgi:hypothetical protein
MNKIYIILIICFGLLLPWTIKAQNKVNVFGDLQISAMEESSSKDSAVYVVKIKFNSLSDFYQLDFLLGTSVGNSELMKLNGFMQCKSYCTFKFEPNSHFQLNRDLLEVPLKLSKSQLSQWKYLTIIARDVNGHKLEQAFINVKKSNSYE